jgi:hypothetical protein
MSYRAALYDSLCAVIAAQWPAVTGICRTSTSSRRSVDERVRNGALPFAAVEFLLTGSPDWGADNKTEEGEILVYYVAADDVSPDDIEALCETLRDYLRLNDTALTNAQVIETPAVADPKHVPLMEYFLSTQRPFNGGAVSVPVVAGETT